MIIVMELFAETFNLIQSVASRATTNGRLVDHHSPTSRFFFTIQSFCCRLIINGATTPIPIGGTANVVNEIQPALLLFYCSSALLVNMKTNAMHLV